MYEISNEGNIRSNNYNKTYKVRNMKPYGKIYLIVTLYKKHKKYYKYIHRLVAETFIKNEKNYPIVNHINGNKKDNKVTNLEWCTSKYNIQEAFKLGLSENKRGLGNGRSLEVNQYTIDNIFIKKWESMRLAETTLNIRHINECCKNKRRTAGGYIWRLAKEDEKQLKGLDIC